METATAQDLVDPLAAAVDSATGEAYVLKDDKLVVIPREGSKTSEVDVKLGVEGFFTPGAGNRVPALANAGHLLLVSKDKLFVVDAKSGASRDIPGKWCLCANDGDSIFLADEKGAVYRAEHGLSNASFPGKLTLLHEFVGEHKQIDTNELQRNDSFLIGLRGQPGLPIRDSGSVLGALCAGSGVMLACQGHGLASVPLACGSEAKELLPDRRSSDGFAFPSALYAVGSTVFAQCPDGIRKLQTSGGSASLAVKASEMVFDDDSGSPEPYPKDFIGSDSKYLYFMVERDFYSGMALRRWPHGCKASAAPSISARGRGVSAEAPREPELQPAPEGTMEMKVSSSKGVGFYIRAAVSFLEGLDARPAEGGKEAVEAKPPVQNLRISALGNAVDTAVVVAQRMASDNLATIQRVQSAYPTMNAGKGCCQLVIDLKKK